jgi:hypothetical protein
MNRYNHSKLKIALNQPKPAYMVMPAAETNKQSILFLHNQTCSAMISIIHLFFKMSVIVDLNINILEINTRKTIQKS